MNRLRLTGFLVVAALALGAAPASASVTLGQAASSPTGTSFALSDLAQLTVGSGPSYVVPGNGTITSWSTNSLSGGSQTMTMKIFRKVAEPSFYQVVGLDGPRNLGSAVLNRFQTNIPVQAGDLLGLNTNANGVDGGITGDAFLNKAPPGLNSGEAANFFTSTGGRLNISAVFEPSNTVTLGATALNKKKGTGTLNLTLPNPGDLTASGPGVSASSAGRATISKAVSAGAAQLLISATGKQKKKLTQKGKVTLNVGITFTPTNGAPATQTVAVKLVKKTNK